MNTSHARSSRVQGVRKFAGALLFVGFGATQVSQATIFFSDAFSYAAGDLGGNGGGTGWSNAWSGGAGSTGNQVLGSSIFAPSDSSARSVQIASNSGVTTRTLSSAYSSGGATTYYVSFLFNANPFQVGSSGDYAGLSLSLSTDPGQSLFLGMPGATGELGFDWSGRAQAYAPASSSTNYLVLVEIGAGSTSSKTQIRMFATTDLSMSGTALASTTPIATADENSFGFDTVNVEGGYSSGSIQFARLAMADNANEAVAFSGISAVPGSGSALMAMLGSALVGERRRIRRPALA